MSRDDVPVNAPPFFRKPLDEACSVADLTSAFRQRLALLRRHDRGEILLIGHDQFEPLTQDGRTRLGRLRSPGRQGGIRELNGASRFQCIHVWHCADNGARRRDNERRRVRRQSRLQRPIDRPLRSIISLLCREVSAPPTRAFGS